MATALDYARLAAYIDSDGCIWITKQRPKDCKKYAQCHLMVAVYNCDLRLLKWCKDTFDCGHIQRHQRPVKNTHRLNYYWNASDQKAEDILRECLPYFIVKREQADIGLAFRDTIVRSQKGIPKANRIAAGMEELRDSFRVKLSAAKRVEYLDVVAN